MGEVIDMFGRKKKVVPIQEAFSPNSTHRRKPEAVEADRDLAERIEHIKCSILRINQLMAELRGMNKNS